MDANQEFWCGRPECRKQFTTKYGLKAHMRKHTGERPFRCQEKGCLKSFKWRSSLVSHSLTHKREREREKRRSVPDSLYAAGSIHVEASENAGPSTELSLGSAGDVSESPVTDIDGIDASRRSALAAMVPDLRQTQPQIGPDRNAYTEAPQQFNPSQPFPVSRQLDFVNNASQQFSGSRQLDLVNLSAPLNLAQSFPFITAGSSARTTARSDSPPHDDAPEPTPF